MKKFGVFLLPLLVAVGIQTAHAVDQAFTVDMEIRQAIAIAVVRSSLSFGVIDSQALAMTVNADNSGIHTAGVGADSAYFTVQGNLGDSANVSVTTPISFGLTNSVNLTVSGGGTVGPFVAAPLDVFVGGTFLLDIADAAAVYSAPATLTVVYVP